MKAVKWSFLLAVFVCALFAGSAGLMAQDFYEKWELDKAKSTMDGRMSEWLSGMDMITTVTGDNVKIEITYKTYDNDYTDDIDLVLGGAAVTRDVMGGRGKSTSKGEWAVYQESVKIHTESTFEGDSGTFTFTTDDHYGLSDDGQNLIVKRTMSSERGTRESTLVFKKKI